MNQEIIGERYQIIKYLRDGGFSKTFIVKDIQNPVSPKYVLKKLSLESSDPTFYEVSKRLFREETLILYHLGKHPQIPNLVADFEENGEFFLVQEFVEGKTLQEELDEGKRFDEREVFYLLGQMLEVLSYVHKQNVIHRDIKPSNIIRRYSDGKLILIDFGAVKQVTDKIDFDQRDLATATVAIGTNGYMASEQLAGNPKYSSDIYSLGMLAIQLLTRKHPMSLKQNPQTGEMIWVNNTSLKFEFAKFIKTMVLYDFRQRFDSAITALYEYKKLKILFGGVKGEYQNAHKMPRYKGEKRPTNFSNNNRNQQSQNNYQHQSSKQNNYQRKDSARNTQQANKKTFEPSTRYSANPLNNGEGFSKVKFAIYFLLLTMLIPAGVVLYSFGNWKVYKHEKKFSDTKSETTAQQFAETEFQKLEREYLLAKYGKSDNSKYHFEIKGFNEMKYFTLSLKEEILRKEKTAETSEAWVEIGEDWYVVFYLLKKLDDYKHFKNAYDEIKFAKGKIRFAKKRCGEFKATELKKQT